MPDTPHPPNSILMGVVLLLAVSVLMVSLARRLKLPSILAYLLTGIALGPHALKLIPSSDAASNLAEYGVVFLMFSIGLEFSLAKLKSMRRLVLTLALPQMVLTMALLGLVLFFMGQASVTILAVAAAVALSSTAIGSKMLTEKAELMSEHGRRVIAVLLAQDIAVVPLLIILPSLARGENMATALGILALKLLVVLALLLGLGPRLMRVWMNLVAARKSPELFILNILLITLGLALLSELAGLSLALGAFLAGMLIAETPYHYQVEEDIKPFRDVLLGLFFITIGMQLNLAMVWAQLPWVILSLLGLIMVKVLVVVGIMWPQKGSLATRLRTAIYLAQAGEFSFVLIALAASLGSIDSKLMQITLAAMLLSLLLSPLLIEAAEPLIKKLTANDWTMRALDLTKMMSLSMARQDHVVICGFGRSGQYLSRMLDAENVRWLAYDHDPHRLKEAVHLSTQVLYGDCVKREVLSSAGLMKARALVVTFTDTEVAKRIIVAARSLREDLPIIVRTTDESTVQVLLDMGASEVVPDVVESAMGLGTQALLHVGTPLAKVLRRLRQLRDERYTLFAGYFHGASDAPENSTDARRLITLHLPEQHQLIGQMASSLALPPTCRLVGVKRDGVKLDAKDPTLVLAGHDMLILLGSGEDLDEAKKLFS